MLAVSRGRLSCVLITERTDIPSTTGESDRLEFVVDLEQVSDWQNESWLSMMMKVCARCSNFS